MSDDIKGLVKKLRAQGKKNYGLYAEVADALEALVKERDHLKVVLVRTAASLAAAISLLETDGKATKKAAPSDKMFKQMLADYNHALGDARKALEAKE